MTWRFDRIQPPRVYDAAGGDGLYNAPVVRYLQADDRGDGLLQDLTHAWSGCDNGRLAARGGLVLGDDDKGKELERRRVVGSRRTPYNC